MYCFVIKIELMVWNNKTPTESYICAMFSKLWASFNLNWRRCIWRREPLQQRCQKTAENLHKLHIRYHVSNIIHETWFLITRGIHTSPSIKSPDIFSKCFIDWGSIFLCLIRPAPVPAHAPGLLSAQSSRPIVPLPHMDICSSVSLKRWTNKASIPTFRHQTLGKWAPRRG